MISLMNVSRYFGSGKKTRFVLSDVSLRVEPMDRIGILALPGEGKSTLARIIAGQERPNQGFVTRKGRISWPIGFAAAFHPSMTGAQNIAAVAKLWNQDPHDLVMRVEDFAQIGSEFHQPLMDLSPGKRSQIALSLSLNTEFDSYLADDMNVSSNPVFRDKCDAALLDKLETAGLIMLSRHPRLLKTFATRFYVLSGGSLIECKNTVEAQDILTVMTEKDSMPHVVA